MTRPTLLPVACGACGWTGKRAPGKPVECPQCGAFAAFQWVPEETQKRLFGEKP